MLATWGGDVYRDRPMFAQLQQVASLLAAQTDAPGPAGCSRVDLFLPIAMMAILYFIWIRPASKERKQHQQMLENLKRGDEVLTQSGIIGTVADISDAVVTLEVARNVKIRVLKSTVSKRMKDIPAGDEGKKKDEDKKKDEEPKKGSEEKKDETAKKGGKKSSSDKS